MASVTHKQGDSFEWVVTLTENFVAVDITNYSIRAQIRANDTLIANLTVTKTTPLSGVFSVTATAAQTDSWSAGTHQCDIEFTDGSSEVFSTETFDVIVLEDISHD